MTPDTVELINSIYELGAVVLGTGCAIIFALTWKG